MTAWNIEIQDSDGASTTVADAAFRKMQLVWTVENQGGGSAEIDLREDQMSTAWTPGLHRLIITGDRGFAGDLTRIGRTGGPDGKLVGYKASAVGLAHRLDYRIVRHPLVVNEAASDIVSDLLDEAQVNQYNGDMGFTMGTVTGTTVTRKRTYCVGICIGDAIRELADIGRGFDWEVDGTGDLNIWNDTRGGTPAFTLDETMCEDFEIELDTSDMLTTVTTLADPSDPFGPAFRLTRTGKAVDYGRREIAVDTDIISSTEENPDWVDELKDYGRGILAKEGGGDLKLRTRWNSSAAPWSLTDVWLQDRIPVTLPAWFGGTVDCRVTDVTVTVDAMPPKGGGDPIYWVEYGWDALVADLDDTDPDA